MNVKAEYVHIAPVSLSSEYPLKKILTSIAAIGKAELTLAETHTVLSTHMPLFTESNSLLFFTKAKLLFEAEVRGFNETSCRNARVGAQALKLLVLFQLAKNRKEHNKGLPTAWSHSGNTDDSALLTGAVKPALKVSIPNFLKDVSLLEELGDPKLLGAFCELFSGLRPETARDLVEKRPMVEIDFSEYYELVNLSGKVVAPEPSKHRKLVISECSNSSIYLRAAFDVVIVTRCRNCEIFLPAVRRIVLVEHSHDLVVTLAARALHLSNVSDSSINVYSLFQPQLLGEIINVAFSPFNANSAELMDKVEAAELEIESEFVGLFATPAVFFNCQEFLDHNKNNFSVVAPHNFETLILPKEFGLASPKNLITDKRLTSLFRNFELPAQVELPSDCLLPPFAPPAYRDALLARHTEFQALKELIKEKKMSKEQEEVFLSAAQGYFREWLTLKPQLTVSLLRNLNTLKF